MSTTQSGKPAASRSWMLSLNLTDKSIAANHYMPFIKNGAIFVPTDKEHKMGDSVFVLLTVGEDARKVPINGKVVWISGANSRGDRPQGVGIQFPKDDNGLQAKSAIEQMIGKMQASMKKTATL